MNSHLRFHCTLFAALLVFGSARVLTRTLDIARVDLFSLKGWNSRQVSVIGLQLGMTLKEAKDALSERGLKLYDMADRTACGPTSGFCNVSKEATQGGADVTVQFGKRGRISMIDVGSPSINPMGYHRNPARITANSFKGETRRFFFHYSDELRLKLLGRPDRVAKNLTTDAIQAQRYTYDHLGLVIYTNRYLRDGMKRPSAPALSSIEFVMPKAVPQKKPGHE